MRWTVRLAAAAISIAALFAAAPTYAQNVEAARSEARAWVDATKSRWGAMLGLLIDYDSALNSIGVPVIVGEMSQAEARAEIARARSRFDEGAAAIRHVINSSGSAPNLASLRQDDAYAHAQAMLDAMADNQRGALDRLTALAVFLAEMKLATSVDRSVDYARGERLRMHSYFAEMQRLLAEAVRSECVESPRDSPAYLWHMANSINLEATSMEHAARAVVLRGPRAEELARLRDDATAHVAALRALIPAIRATAPRLADLVAPSMPEFEGRPLQPSVVFRVLPEAVARFADELERRPAYWAQLTPDEIVKDSDAPNEVLEDADSSDETPEDSDSRAWPDLLNHIFKLSEPHT